MRRNPKKPRFSTAASPLTDDLVEFAILPRLPAKALTRFKCVSKKWHQIISSPSALFVYMQSQQAASCLLPCCFSISDCISRDPRSLGVPSFAKHIKRILGNPLSRLRIVATCNGLLCCIEDGFPYRIVIGNPSLKNWKLLPVNPSPNLLERIDVVYGLAVDVEESSVWYRLLLLVFMNNNEYELHVFSSATQKWTEAMERIMLPVGVYIDLYQVAVYAEDYMYWRLEDEDDSRVFWFNIETKLYGLHQLPQGVDDPNHGCIGQYGGKLSYAMIKDRGIQIWSLDNQHWYRRFSITLDIVANSCHTMKLRKTRRKDVSMISFEGGDFLTFRVDGVIYSYDILAGKVRRIIEADPPCCYWFPYKNTLVSSSLEEGKEVRCRRIEEKDEKQKKNMKQT